MANIYIVQMMHNNRYLVRRLESGSSSLGLVRIHEAKQRKPVVANVLQMHEIYLHVNQITCTWFLKIQVGPRACFELESSLENFENKHIGEVKKFLP